MLMVSNVNACATSHVKQWPTNFPSTTFLQWPYNSLRLTSRQCLRLKSSYEVHFEELLWERYILKGQIAFEGHWRLRSWILLAAPRVRENMDSLYVMFIGVVHRFFLNRINWLSPSIVGKGGIESKSYELVNISMICWWYFGLTHWYLY